MPGQFLSQLERERLQSFPLDLTDKELITFFTFSKKDLTQIKKRSGDHNRIGFALQLGTLRYLGFVPDDLTQLPSIVVNYVAEQLNVSPSVLSDYGERPQTRTNQLQEIQDYLGFRKPSKLDYKDLKAWLQERAMEHDRPLLLFQLLIKKLETAKIVRPGLSILERMVASSRTSAWTETCIRLKPILTAERSQFLDSLLLVDAERQRTPLAWLRTGAVSNSPSAILNALAKLEFLNQQNVKDWDVSSLNPNRVKFLAKLGKKSTAQALSRTPTDRTHADDYFDFFALRYSYLRSFARNFLAAMSFSSNRQPDALIDAIATLRSLDATGKRKIPENTSLVFVPSRWRDYVVDDTGKIVRRYYELCVLWELRTALRSGNIWLNNSRRYANPESYRPSGKAEGRGQKAEGKKKVFKDCLCALPKPGLRPPPNFQFGGLRKDMGLNPLIFTPSAFCLRTSAFLQLIPKKQWLELKNEVCQLLECSESGRSTIQQRCQELSQLLSKFDASFNENEQVRNLDFGSVCPVWG
jgi:TnpA family transposase